MVDGVNLPRWGLKRNRACHSSMSMGCVNLPRWGLKLKELLEAMSPIVCKFTPLGFETKQNRGRKSNRQCVNLPRWGLKPPNSAK